MRAHSPYQDCIIVDLGRVEILFAHKKPIAFRDWGDNAQRAVRLGGDRSDWEETIIEDFLRDQYEDAETVAKRRTFEGHLENALEGQPYPIGQAA